MIPFRRAKDVPRSPTPGVTIVRGAMFAVTSLIAATTLIAVACEGRGANVVGPAGSEAFTRFVAIGTAITMGTQSSGVVYDAQVRSWPALLARQAGATFTVPQLRSPGCSPPLIAPLQFGRLLSGADVARGDSSCAGLLAGIVPPTHNLALSGATAWAALTLTPKMVTATPFTFGIGDRSRYPLVLGASQSQVTAMRVLRPSFVSVELGAAEVFGAVFSGLLVPATAYGQREFWTYVPPALFSAVYSAIADSVKNTGAHAVLLGVPRVTSVVSLRAGNELWADRVALAANGIAVGADCEGSANLVATAPLVPVLAARARVEGGAHMLSCADVAGAVDNVLTPSDVIALSQMVDQMNAQIKSVADRNGWAYADVNSVFAQAFASRGPYSATTHLGCVFPFGQYLSLDGVNLNSAGHQLLSNAVGGAINVKYGYGIPEIPVPVVPPSQLCP